MLPKSMALTCGTVAVPTVVTAVVGMTAGVVKV